MTKSDYIEIALSEIRASLMQGDIEQAEEQFRDLLSDLLYDTVGIEQA